MADLDKFLNSLKDTPEMRYLEDLNLSKFEKAQLAEMLAEQIDTGASPTYDLLQSADYIRTPISARRFIEDPYYSGRVGETVFPGVKEDFISMFDRSIPVLDLILTGSLRWGKSFLIALVCGYLVYRLSCLKNPQKYLGLSPISSIYLINLSVTGYQASEGIFSDFLNFVDESPYFKEHFARDKKVSSIANFPNNIIFKSGSSSEFSAIGKNVYVGIIDESNFFGVKQRSSRSIDASGEYDAARNLYDALSRRIRLTYTSHGIASGMMILSSSARYPNDFIERRVQELEKLKTLGSADLNAVVFRHTVWEVKSPEMYVKPRFKVEVGSQQNRSRVLPDDIDLSTVTGRVVEVPGEFKNIFLDNPDSALRDLAGISTLSISPFFTDRERVNACFSDTYVHPYSEEISTNLQGHLLIPKLAIQDRFSGKYYPRYDKGSPRGVALDLSISGDPTGISVAHVAGYKKISIEDPYTSKVEEVTRPIIKVDLVQRVIPPRHGEIDYAAIVNLLFKLRLFGFNLLFITADQVQSAAILQTFQKKGIDARVKSSREKKYRPYAVWKSAVYEGRFICYEYPPLLTEMVELEEREGVVDHPVMGHNDLCDSMASLVDELHTRFFATDQRSIPLMGETPLGDPTEIDRRSFDLQLESPAQFLTSVSPKLKSTVDQLVFQRIPIPWSSFTSDDCYVILNLLKLKSQDLDSLGRYPQAKMCLDAMDAYKSYRQAKKLNTHG